MIRIELDRPTLDRTRIAISPLWETICSLHLLQRNPGGVSWPYAAWAERARAALASAPRTAPARFYLRLGSRSPDAFTPIPSTPWPTLEDELDALRDTPGELVREQLRRYYPDGAVPAGFRPFCDRPGEAFGRLAEGISAYWDAAIAPYWPKMRAALDEEVLHRARALAVDGPDALLRQLHERIVWSPPVLTLIKSVEQSFHARDQRLLLIPLIFSRGALMCSSDHPDVVAVSYQARGSAVIAEGPPSPGAGPDETDRLAILFGRGRAAVLRALARPTTTAGLAATLRLAPSTVSEHLTALANAGVVHRRRAGRRVLYGLDPAGVALVTLLGAADAGDLDASSG